MARAKPPAGALLDYARPPAARLAEAYLLAEGVGARARDARSGRDLTLSSASWTPGPDGPAFRSASAYSGHYFAAPYYAETAAALRVRRTGGFGSGNQTLCAHHTSDGTGSDWSLYFHDDNKLHVDIPWGGANNVVIGSTAVTDSDWHTVGFRRTGSSGSWTYEVFLDGRLDGTGTTATNPAGNPETLYLGQLSDGFQLFPAADFGWFYRFAGAPPMAALLGLHADPYGLFAAPPVRRFFAPAAGGGTTLAYAPSAAAASAAYAAANTPPAVTLTLGAAAQPAAAAYSAANTPPAVTAAYGPAAGAASAAYAAGYTPPAITGAYGATAAPAAVAYAASGGSPGAAITSNGTGGGDWNATGSWAGGVIPASGDTVTILSGDTITVPSGYTAVCGNSPADDTGTPALQATAFSTGRLVVSGTFKYRGPIRQGESHWTVNAGGTVTYDASGATTPASALYTWQVGQTADSVSYLEFLGTSGSRCSVTSQGGYQSGGFVDPAGSPSRGCNQIRAKFTDFSNVGPAAGTGNFAWTNLNDGAQFYLEDCTLTDCGQIQALGPFNEATGIHSTATFRLLRTKITSPANTTYTLQIYTSSGWRLTTGERRIEGCDLAGHVALPSSDSGGLPTLGDWTIRHNVFRPLSPSQGSTPALADLSGTGVAEWKQNLLANVTGDGSIISDPKCSMGCGTFADSYSLRLPTPGANGSNMHVLYNDQRAGDVAYDGWIFQSTADDTSGDYVNLTLEAASARQFKVINSVFLENRLQLAAGSLVNNQGSVTQNETTTYFDHNTLACGLSVTLPSTGAVYGVGKEGGTLPAGAIPSIRSNLAWRRTSGEGLIANSDTTGTTIASGAVTAADYNWTSGVTGSIYGNPSSQFASTPGTHDGTGDPAFVDQDRSILNFDQGYLSQPAGPVWTSGATYSVGNVVSSSVATFYGGATYNWRCVQAHTAGATTQPGSGDNFPLYWEPAALKLISDDVLAGNTYAAGTNSLIGELVGWVKAGFAPTNAATATAAHDGTTVGAVAYQGTAPAVTLDYAPAAAPAAVSYGLAYTPPAATLTLGAAARPAAASYSTANTPPAATLAYGAAASPASTAYPVSNTPPAATLVYAPSAGAASAAYGAGYTPPAVTAAFGPAARPAVVAYVAAGGAPARHGPTQFASTARRNGPNPYASTAEPV